MMGDGDYRNQHKRQDGGCRCGRRGQTPGRTKSVSQGGKHRDECYQPCLFCVYALKSDQGRTELIVPDPTARAHGTEKYTTGDQLWLLSEGDKIGGSGPVDPPSHSEGRANSSRSSLASSVPSRPP
jgi:hypothetical protein